MIQRWMIAACAVGMQRLVVEECLKYVGIPSSFLSSHSREGGQTSALRSESLCMPKLSSGRSWLE